MPKESLKSGSNSDAEIAQPEQLSPVGRDRRVITLGVFAAGFLHFVPGLSRRAAAEEFHHAPAINGGDAKVGEVCRDTQKALDHYCGEDNESERAEFNTKLLEAVKKTWDSLKPLSYHYGEEAVKTFIEAVSAELHLSYADVCIVKQDMDSDYYEITVRKAGKKSAQSGYIKLMFERATIGKGKNKKKGWTGYPLEGIDLCGNDSEYIRAAASSEIKEKKQFPEWEKPRTVSPPPPERAEHADL